MLFDDRKVAARDALSGLSTSTALPRRRSSAPNVVIFSDTYYLDFAALRHGNHEDDDDDGLFDDTEPRYGIIGRELPQLVFDDLDLAVMKRHSTRDQQDIVDVLYRRNSQTPIPDGIPRSKRLRHRRSSSNPSFAVLNVFNDPVLKDLEVRKAETKPIRKPSIVPNERFQTNHLIQTLSGYHVTVVNDLSLERTGEFRAQCCPLCLSSFPSEGYFLLTCKQIGCCHVVHTTCIKSEDQVGMLMTGHVTMQFLIRQSMPEIFPAMRPIAVSPRSRATYFLTVQVLHLVAENIILEFRTESSPAIIDIDTKVHRVTYPVHDASLNVRKGRIRIQVFAETSLQNQLHSDVEAIFDLSDVTHDNVDLISIDAHASLRITLLRGSRTRSWNMQRLTCDVGRLRPLRTLESFTDPQSMEVEPIEDEEIPEETKSYEAVSDEQHFLRHIENLLESPVSDRKRKQKVWKPKPLSPFAEEDEEKALAKGSFDEEYEDYIIPSAEVQGLLPHIPGKIEELARTQSGSRFLQERIDGDDQEYMKLIMNEVMHVLPSLMTDLFGNYLCQKLFRRCSEEDRQTLLRRLGPDMSTVSCDRQGTRVMQKIIEHSRGEEDIGIVLDSLRPKILELVYDPHGSYVVNAMLDHISSDKLDFILELLCEKTRELAVDQHGLCVYKKCLTNASPDWTSRLMENVVNDLEALVDDQYGNYLIQHILGLGDELSIEMLHTNFRGKYTDLSKLKFSSNVVEKCLSSYPRKFRKDLIYELMKPSEILVLLQDSYGNYVMQNALSVAEGSQAHQLIEAIRPELRHLRKKIQKKWDRLLKQAASRVDGGGTKQKRRKE